MNDLPMIPDHEDDPYPGLSERHRRFVDALVLNGGKQGPAYASVYGCEAHVAVVNASRLLLTNAAVSQAYELRRAQLAQQAQISQERLLASLNDDAFGLRTGIYEPSSWLVKPMDQWPEAIQRCIEGVQVDEHERESIGKGGEKIIHRSRKVILKFPSRMEAKRLLGDYLGLWEKSASASPFTLQISLQENTIDQSINQSVTIGDVQLNLGTPPS